MTIMKRLLLLVLIMAATAFFGELKMNPFGSQFRFSLGTCVYFFGLIWFRQLRPFETGVSVGLFLMLFRSLLDVTQHGGTFWSYLPDHLPSAVYYLLFASFLTLTNLRKRLDSPMLVGITGTLGDLVGNIGELLTRNALGADYVLGPNTVLVLLLFGALRSFFVVGLYNMLMIRQVRALGQQQQKQIDRLLLINSSLYEEGFYLQKSMLHIEEITRSSYELYKQLIEQEKRGQTAPALSRRALLIAEEVHELKKDSQRILAGLDKLIKQESLRDRMPLLHLNELVIGANAKYAEMLGKEIEFSTRTDINLGTTRIYPLLSILNNLTANAVEAIPHKGRVGLEVMLREGSIEWHVWDDGPGISADDSEYIYQPGYTTKYDSLGNPSTGIGLSHCQDLAAMLGGSLTLLQENGVTRFIMRMPTYELLSKEKGR
ncbi:sensor histidine kinase [Tumebacillus avium]|uniref:sensor histidine kinase n=1 Tax=Tumebacillus avium TaxID=1903704 RepID=UPI001E657440|nr:sensor histidine kinase [Tumebacillus avium]